MKILSLTNTSLDPALGSGKTRLAWTSGFRDSGNTVDIVTPSDYYRTWPLGKAKRIKMRLDVLGLEDMVNMGNYDIVEFYGAEFGLLTKRLSQLLRKDRPLLVAHTDGLELLASRMQDSRFKQTTRQSCRSIATNLIQPVISRIDYLAFSCADCFVTGCEADQKFIVENNILPLERCAVVEPGIDELLSLERCGTVVERIRQLPGYDLVIFDTPPALLLSDPVLLAEHLDGLIFLVGLSRVNRDLPAQALQRVGDTGVDVLGVLANQPVVRGAGRKGYGYGYGGYGRYGDGARSGYGAYAEAAEQRDRTANVVEGAPDQAKQLVHIGNDKGTNTSFKTLSKKPLAVLKTGSQRLMQWLDERE